MSYEIPPEEAPADVRRLATEVESFAIEHMLRSVRVFTGAHIIEVAEPSIYADDQRNLAITIQEFDL